MSDAEVTDARRMYTGLVAGWSQEEIIEHILYWRAKSDGLTREVEVNNQVKHLRRRIQALTRKLRTVREAAVNYKRSREFNALVMAMEVRQGCGNRCGRMA